jgi:hypothetical protein
MATEAPTLSPPGGGGSSTFNGTPANTATALDALDTMAGNAPPAPDPGLEPADPSPPPPAPKPASIDPKPTPPPPGEKTQPKPPEKAATLRASYETTKAALAKAEARLKELESTAAKPKDDAAVKDWQAKHDAATKRVSELENEIKFVNYEKHPEFQEKYVKPMHSFYADGIEEAKGFRVTDENGERHGTEKDFDALMAIPDQEKAWQFAEERFGTKASIMWQHRKNFIKAVHSKNQALEDFRKQGAEREKMTMEQRASEERQNSETWSNLVKEGVQKYPDHFGRVEGDAEGNQLLDSGMAMASLAFGVLAPENIDKLPASVRAKLVDGKLPKGEQLKLHSAIHNMAGGFIRSNHLLSKERAKNKELQEKISAYEASDPGNRGGEGGGKPPGKKQPMSWEQQLDSIAQ